MKFTIMTLFPEMIESVLSESIIGRAKEAGIIEIEAFNIRDYSKDKHKHVDDTPYGGGKGMLMSAVPIYDCYCDILKKNNNFEGRKKKVIYMSPQGHTLTQTMASSYSKELDDLIILCGHYEGVDQRILDEIVDEEVSIGDYVLTGGELPACILVDCISRLIPGVLSDSECYEKESFSDNLLEYPQYTRPYEFHGVKVPDVLISGHHKNIEEWRRQEAIKKTEKMRPDLLERKD